MSEKNNFCSKTARLAFIPSRALLDDEELLDDNREDFDLREPRDEFDLISSFNSRRSKRQEASADIFSHEFCTSFCSFVILFTSSGSLAKLNQFTNSCKVLSAEFFSA